MGQFWAEFINIMDPPRIELGFHRCERCVLPLYYGPINKIINVDIKTVLSDLLRYKRANFSYNL